MKKMLLAMLLILPGFFAQAGNEVRSLVDLGICTDGQKVARFLDGDRLKLEQFVFGDKDYRHCRSMRDGNIKGPYACATDAWQLHIQGVDAADLAVRIHLGKGEQRHTVELIDRDDQVVMSGVCTPHRW